MSLDHYRLRWFSCSVCLLSVSALFACSSSDAVDAVTHRTPSSDDGDSPTSNAAAYERDGSVYDSTPSSSSGLGVLRFMPSIIYSGYDGTHTFTVPIAVYDAAGNIDVVADDPSAVTVTPTALKNPVSANGASDSGRYFMLTIHKAGTVLLTASSGGQSASARLNVTSYDADRWAAGDARYQNGGPSGNPPCRQCHIEGSAIDHSPAAMASARDGEIGFIITNGMKPGPTAITGVDCAACSEQGKKHQWTVTDEERLGLITYLRSLEPRGFR